MADHYKSMAKIFFILQLFVAWAIVVISTLYASSEDLNDYGNADPLNYSAVGETRDWWVVSDKFTIDALGETVFALTIVAAFLISLESYFNAKARQPLA